MYQDVKMIRLRLPYRLGAVNCYLVKTGDSFIVVDTGSANQRLELEKELASAGCTPGSLKLIVLTHGDFDHTGNAAHLRSRFDTQVAMHDDDAGMVERGDMFWNRKKGNALLRIVGPVLFGFGKAKRFKPDVRLDEGSDLGAYGCDARVLSIPGHSKGSIGILTAEGNLFCGDLFDNTSGPVLNSIMDDLAAAHASVKKLRSLSIDMVYPGHGEPFPMEHIVKDAR